MGYGGYDNTATNCFVRTRGLYADKGNDEIFAKAMSSAMAPKGVTLRESRDSADHPNSLALILGLDVTGSMGAVPNYLVKDGFSAIMDKIIKNGELDPQILFLGIGDHKTDSFPFQVGQFESNDELLHKWLTQVFIEGNGGGNGGESYLLAWYFAAYRTATDCFEKRGRKGLLFTAGDEPFHQDVPKESLERIFGSGDVQYANYTAKKLLAEARKSYDVYHIHVKETSTGNNQGTIDGLRKLLGENLIVVEDSKNVASVIAETILKHKQEGTSKTEVADEPEVIL